MKVGITGGLGLLGQAVVRCLIDRGHAPVIIDRAVTADLVDQKLGGVPQIKADICNEDQITEACSGLEGIIHTASLIDLHLGRPASLYDVNVAGAKNVVLACRHNGIQKLVHMSSAEVISGTEPLRGVTETEAAYPATQLTFYGLTKRSGEELVLAAADDTLGTCAIRAYGMYGPGDNTVLPMYLKTLPGRSIIQIGDLTARSDMIYADNLAHGLILAVEQLEPASNWSGTVFHITDYEAINVQQFLAEMVKPLGYRVVERARLPRLIATALARFYESRYRLTGLERFARPPLTTHKLRLALDDYWLDSTRVRKVLGYEPPFTRAESIAETQAWLLASAGRVDPGNRQ